MSWFWEAPDWILDMSWFIGSDCCCKLLRARAVDWSVGLGSRIWSDAHQNPECDVGDLGTTVEAKACH